MSTAYTYPGVYVEELPSSVRSIIGVGTSTTAFVGCALKGPTDKATVIHSFADYSRIFGGLWKKSNMSYAVYHYFQNGGVDAIIVRVVNSAKAAKFTPSYSAPNSSGETLTGLNLKVANPGVWGEKLDIVLSDADKAKKAQDGDDTYFDIAVYQKISPGERGPLLEMFRNVSLNPEKPRFIGKLLADGVSTYLRIDYDKPNTNTPVPELPGVPGSGSGDVSPPVSPAKAGDVAPIKFELNPIYNLVDNSASDGAEINANIIIGDSNDKTGMYALKDADLFNLLCIPTYNQSDADRKVVYNDALPFCSSRRAILLIDPPAGGTPWNSTKAVLDGINDYVTRDKNGVIFFPRIVAPDPLEEYRLREFDPCGAVAGVIARTDAQRGVWKAPAGIEAVLSGVPDLAVRLTNEENGELNPKGINCLRIFPDVGRVIWGARTLRGADSLADQWKYLPVRRMALYIEETLYRGTQWVVFEPNDERLWSQIRLNVGAFMHTLFVKGAFQGSDPKQAYLVKCDSETTTQTDIDAGIVNVLVGFAPLKPAEFVILKIQQLAGQESE
ncbi:MAG: phage tail sheath subtilisin-like domain-containing protein [Nitrososphaerota archaeon]|jgi:phage tail sheath protein FI|nr:phage tail sheath subtilisin-like domain-containing protein [Nitrososphaerota archaeon]